MTVLTVVFAGIAALGGLGGFAAFLVVHDQRTKIRAEAKKLDVDADVLMSDRALELYDRVSREAKDARSRANSCEDRMDALEDHVNLLNRLVRDLGGNPPPFRYPILNLASGNDE